MDGIAASFGASKSTIYRRYGSKAGLLSAAVERGVPLLLDPLAKVATDARRLPRSVLRDYGEIIQSYHADPSIRAMWRAVSEAREELGDLPGTLSNSRTGRWCRSPITWLRWQAMERSSLPIRVRLQRASAR
jgi:AcrR family transcriptional regulator